MKKSISILLSRLLLGFVYFIFGLNGFLNFIPLPAKIGKDKELLNVLISSGYLFQSVKASEVLLGVLLLAGKYIPLTLIALFPITLNIFLFHLFLNSEGMPIAIFLLSLHIYLAIVYRRYYFSLFIAKTEL